MKHTKAHLEKTLTGLMAIPEERGKITIRGFTFSPGGILGKVYKSAVGVVMIFIAFKWKLPLEEMYQHLPQAMTAIGGFLVAGDLIRGAAGTFSASMKDTAVGIAAVKGAIVNGKKK